MTFTGIKNEYYETGELKSTCFECNGIKEGEYKEWFNNGTLENIVNYKNDDK